MIVVLYCSSLEYGAGYRLLGLDLEVRFQWGAPKKVMLKF